MTHIEEALAGAPAHGRPMAVGSVATVRTFAELLVDQ